MKPWVWLLETLVLLTSTRVVTWVLVPVLPGVDGDSALMVSVSSPEPPDATRKSGTDGNDNGGRVELRRLGERLESEVERIRRG